MWNKVYIRKEVIFKLYIGIVAHVCNPSILEAKARELP